MAPDPLQWLCTTWCPLFGGSPAEPGEPGFGHRGVTQPHGVEPPCHFTMSRHLNTFKDMSRGANVQDGHVHFWLVVFCQASPKQQPEVDDKAGDENLADTMSAKE